MRKIDIAFSVILVCIIFFNISLVSKIGGIIHRLCYLELIRDVENNLGYK